MKTIIAGGRMINDYDVVLAAIEASGFTITQVVSGCAEGADRLGEQWAYAHDLPIARFPADWKMHGKAAGPIRNGGMAQYADALIAIWDGTSRGTANMIEQAERRGLRVFVYRVKSGALSQTLPQ